MSPRPSFNFKKIFIIFIVVIVAAGASFYIYKNVNFKRARPNNPQIQGLMDKAMSDWKSGKIKEAEATFSKVVTIDPQNAQAYFSLAYLNETAGQPKKALEYYEKTILLDPKNSEVHYNLGNIYAHLQLNEKAVFSYQQAVKFNPKHVNAWVNLSILSFYGKDFVHAVEYCDRAVALGYKAPAEYLEALKQYRKK